MNVGEQIQSVEDGISKLKIGDSGYYFVLNAANGADRGKLIVHPAAAGQLADDANAPYKQMLDMKQGQLEYRSADATLGEPPRATNTCRSSRCRNGNGWWAVSRRATR